ncbi:hypothetical protein [Phyllobacterium myrsinacearum]|uniref:Uncharacterized protein n=1 Tax=Phyllobacterium myrsinacearum TaxID=28101 RepID=A0A839ELE3_9HYPH|nr:hypothetical protein [Phyllobacterium myrsinacearum]MBA8880871.1 hypothetical protein [Phyllobacterium myrsinacearum]
MNESDPEGVMVTVESISKTPLSILRSSPDHIQRHDISDEELTFLLSTDQSIKGQFLWTAIGACLGAASPTVEAFKRLGTAEFGTGSLTNCIIFGAALVVIIVLLILKRKEPDLASETAKAIRSRTSRIDN